MALSAERDTDPPPADRVISMLRSWVVWAGLFDKTGFLPAPFQDARVEIIPSRRATCQGYALTDLASASASASPSAT